LMAEAAVEESRSLLEAATAVPTAAARRRCPRPALLLLLLLLLATLLALTALQPAIPATTTAVAGTDVPRVDQPHIVLVLADDMGWNDVSLHGSAQIPTPHIAQLAATGVTLDQYYVQPVCSPTRACLLTGRHVTHTGIYGPIEHGAVGALPRRFTLLPGHLERLGYRSYISGKWHLGFTTWGHVPTARGFSRFYGFYTGAADHYTHFSGEGYDMRNGTTIDWEPRCDAGRAATAVEGNGGGSGGGATAVTPATAAACSDSSYSTHLFTSAAQRFVREHAAHLSSSGSSSTSSSASSKPMFLYLSYQAMHSPTQAPDAYTAPFATSIPHTKRREVAGMMSAMDEGIGKKNDDFVLPFYAINAEHLPRQARDKHVKILKKGHWLYAGNLTATLRQVGMHSRSLFVFSTDNGGAAASNGNMASNWPLRGGKNSLYEGGVRGVAIIAGYGVRPSLRGTVTAELMHVVDWAPTLVSLVTRGVSTPADRADAAASASEDVDDASPSTSARRVMDHGLDWSPPWELGDGMDLSRVFTDGAPSPRTEVLLEAHPADDANDPDSRSKVHGSALRVGRWKLLVEPRGSARRVTEGLLFGEKAGTPHLNIFSGFLLRLSLS
jgi:arylsulfatase A-like enzyme